LSICASAVSSALSRSDADGIAVPFLPPWRLVLCCHDTTKEHSFGGSVPLNC